MTIELTQDEAQFLIDNIQPLQVQLINPNAAQIVAVGQSVWTKISEAMKSEAKAAEA